MVDWKAGSAQTPDSGLVFHFLDPLIVGVERQTGTVHVRAYAQGDKAVGKIGSNALLEIDVVLPELNTTRVALQVNANDDMTVDGIHVGDAIAREGRRETLVKWPCGGDGNGSYMAHLLLSGIFLAGPRVKVKTGGKGSQGQIFHLTNRIITNLKASSVFHPNNDNPLDHMVH